MARPLQEGAARVRTGAAMSLALALLVAGCRSDPGGALGHCDGDGVPLCQRPRSEVDAVGRLRTYDEVTAAIIDGRVRGMCGTGGAAPTSAWTACVISDAGDVVITATTGPTGAIGVLGPGSSFPMEVPHDEVVVAAAGHGPLTLEVLTADGERIGRLGVGPAR